MKGQLKKEGLSALCVYLFTWLFALLFVLYQYVNDGSSFAEGLNAFFDLAKRKNVQIALHILFLTFYLIFIVIRYFVKVYRNKGVVTMIRRFVLRLVLPVLLLSFSYNSIVHMNNNEGYGYEWDHSVENPNDHSNNLYDLDEKHRGVHVFGWTNNNDKALADVIKNNVEWVAIVPFLYQEDEQTKTMRTPRTVGKWSRQDSTFIKAINDSHEKRVRVMLKPHLWLDKGWRSNVTMQSDEEWDYWFESYRENMLHYAKMAALTKVELLCIGTELRTSIKQQPKAWMSLVKDIRAIYHGKLTYAANWDDDNDLGEFWDAMDYIGIQAYFPLTKDKAPDLETIKAGWGNHISNLEELSKKYDRPILFTEVGYKSEVSATIKPWEWDSLFSGISKKKSDITQQLAYQALFESLWHKKWFAGLYIWQWQVHSKKEKALKNLDFSPRFKPAENTIAKWFGKPSNANDIEKFFIYSGLP